MCMKVALTLTSRFVIHIQDLFMLTSVIAPLLLFFPEGSHLNAQATFGIVNDDGNTHTINYSGSYADLIIPDNPRITELQITLKGGDGGTARIYESIPIIGTVVVDCKAKGGEGATVYATISIGNGPGQVPHGTLLRFIIGGVGESKTVGSVAGFSVGFGVGGGGGSAVLYHIYGESNFEIIGAAGGGGGAFNSALAYICSRESGQGGRATEDAGAGGGELAGYGGSLGYGGGDGGIPPAEISGGGGGAFGNGEGAYCIDIDGLVIMNSGGGLKGMPFGGEGGSEFGCDIFDWYDGGYGFGGGGGAFAAAGGGGGYSGGGGGGIENIIDGQGGNGGGGGSYLAGFASGKKFAGGNTSTPNHGHATYRCILNEPPVAVCVNTPTTVQLNMGGVASIGVGLINNGSYDVESDPMTMSLSQSDFYCSDVGSNIVTLSVTDGYNTSTCTSEIIVQDNIPPILFCQDVNVRLDSFGIVNVNPEDLVLGVFENCSMGTISLSQEDFYCDDIGENSIILYAPDLIGNMTACKASIFVQDNIQPSLECQDLTISLENDGMASISPNMVISYIFDACSIESSILSTSDFSCADIGSNIVTLSVSDGLNTSTCTSEIVVEDNSPPILYCQDVNVRLDAFGFVNVDADDLVVSVFDNCAFDNTYLSQEDFYCADIGENPVILYASDIYGNITTCLASIFVQDNIPPQLKCQSRKTILGDEGITSITPDMVISNIYDACGIEVLSLSQSNFDCSDVGDNLVTLTAIDSNGNASSCDVSIGVFDLTKPTMNCIDVKVVMDEFGNASVTPEMIDDGIYDACGLLTMYLDIDEFSCYLGDYQVTLTAIDVNFNRSTCDVIVTVIGADQDCDTVHDACDVCNGGNDLIDENMDGRPDCTQALAYDDYHEDWHCGKDQILVCHYGLTKCVKTQSIPEHLKHGDYVGPCNDADCIGAFVVESGEMITESEELEGKNGELIVERSGSDKISDVVFRLYPNPAFDQVLLELDQIQGFEIILYIQNHVGNIILQRKLDTSPGHIREMVDVSEFAAGIYYIRIMDGEDSVVRKLIIVQ